MWRKIKRILLGLLIVLVVCALGVFIAFQVSPVPGAYLISRMFSGEVTIQDPERYEIAHASTSVISDLEYPSKHKLNTLDIFYPNDYASPVPVVFWVHGGGYVGGDKSGVNEFANYLVHEVGVAVVSINYQHAPGLTYPGQVVQLGEAYTYIQSMSETYPMLDLSKVFFGGDSAGSQIAAQYVVIQTNDAYANSMSFSQSVPKESILGYISYCGPLELKQMLDVEPESFMMRFFINTVGWSLMGSKDWKSSPLADQISLVSHLTSDFPPSYITDGNAFSFQDQGIEFSNQLKTLGIPVDTLFFKNDTSEVTHEYQFNFSDDNAKKSLDITLNFIKAQLD